MQTKAQQFWIDFDQTHIWHPYAPMLNAYENVLIESAQGVYLELADGRRLVDGMSSWWAAIHGYNHPVLNAAISAQMGKMSHVMFGGLTHKPAIRLAETLINITDPALQHIFFADSGSVSVEVALKMALQYCLAQGQSEKKRILTVRGGYHGDTFGAMSVCDPENGMHHLFRGILAQQLFVPKPECSDDQDNATVEQAIHPLQVMIEAEHKHIAAVIIEPLVQGAGGMHFYCAEYLRRLRSLCDAYDILLIFDEIATGFGRTGSLFAYEQAEVVPDILCLGKALTGGYMTLAATLTSTKIAEGMSADNAGVLMHGPTFMANPLACSVASASIELLLSSDWQQGIANIETQLRQNLAACTELEAVKDVRVKGAIGVVELKQPVNTAQLQPLFVEQGVWVRPFRNLIYIMPPYIIQETELLKLSQAIFYVIKTHLSH